MIKWELGIKRNIYYLKIVELLTDFIDTGWFFSKFRRSSKKQPVRDRLIPHPQLIVLLFFTFRRLLSNGTYVAAYPLHDGKPTKDDNSGARCSRRVRIFFEI